MDAAIVARFKLELEERRAELHRLRLTTEREALEVHEGNSDPEYEETAQADNAEYTLRRLSEGQERELSLIEGALARVEDGSYGRCLECAEDIPLQRLEALPYAILDTDCASRLEERYGVVHTPSL